MIDWRWLILLSLAAGAGIGYGIGQQRAARDLARLRELVPSPGLLRRMADDADHMGDRYATEASLGVPGAAENERRSRIDDKTARDLAARIEAAGAGAVTVPPAWEQTPTGRE